MRTKRRKRRKVILPILTIVGILFLFYFIYNSLFSFKRKIKNEIDYYRNNSANQISFYDNLFYNKFSINEGVQKIPHSNWTVQKINGSNYGQIALDRLNEFFEQNRIATDEISIYIRKGKNSILEINSQTIREDYNIEKYLYLIALRNLYISNSVNLDDSIILLESDFADGSTHFSTSYIDNAVKLSNLIQIMISKDDQVSLNAIKRYMARNNFSLTESINEEIAAIDISSLNPIQATLIIEEYSKSNVRQADIFNILDENSNSLYLNSIHTQIPSLNIYRNSDGVKYDFGKVESDNSYFYSIYSEKLTQKEFQVIGDIINRTIDEFETKQKVK